MTVSFADAAVNLDDLEAQGYFACVTDDMRRKAEADFTATFAKRNPPEVYPGRAQGDLFGSGL